MAPISKTGGGRFSALASNRSPSPKRDTSSPARMLNASERKSLREFATSRIKAGSVTVRETGTGRFVVRSKPSSACTLKDGIKR
jgi:hypothetical protein